MSIHNLGQNISTGLAIEPQDSAAATVTGKTIDTKGYEGLVFTGIVGQASGSPTAQSVVFKLQEGDQSNGSDASDISGATVTSSSDSEAKEINQSLETTKRYITFVATVSFTGGTSPKIEVGGAYTLGQAKTLPV